MLAGSLLALGALGVCSGSQGCVSLAVHRDLRRGSAEPERAVPAPGPAGCWLPAPAQTSGPESLQHQLLPSPCQKR